MGQQWGIDHVGALLLPHRFTIDAAHHGRKAHMLITLATLTFMAFGFFVSIG